jgi:hypothetical protein
MGHINCGNPELGLTIVSARRSIVPSLVPAVPATIVAIVFVVLFIDKAFTIDDVTFLLMARHMLTDPLHPSALEMVFHGVPGRVSQGVSGPVMPILLLPAVLRDGAEWLAHISMMFVFVLGIIFSAAFAIRLGMSRPQAFWVALLVATTPAVLGMATTSMPDVPAMSFAIVGTERLLAFRQSRRASAAVTAAVALALAVLSRPHLSALFVCLLPLLLTKWPSSLRQLWDSVFQRSFLQSVAPIAGAVVILAMVALITRDPLTGANLAATSQQNLTSSNLRINLANLPAQWVLSFPLGVVWTTLYWRRMARSPWCWGAALVGAGLAVLTQAHYQSLDWLWWQAPLTGLGTAVLADIFLTAWRQRDLIEISLGIWLLIAWPAALYGHLPPKYLVPSAPAMALILVRHAWQTLSSQRRKQLLATASSLGLILGLLIASADAALGEAGRVGGRDIVGQELKRGERVWFDGGWGFQWYAMHAGARPMTKGPPYPEHGDIVIQGLTGTLMDDWQNKVLVRRVIFDEPGGRVLDAPAGFFSNGWGPLPWRWSSNELARVQVWRVE